MSRGYSVDVAGKVTAHVRTTHQTVSVSQPEMTHLNTANDGGGECGVVLCAQHDGVHQNKSVQ